MGEEENEEIANAATTAEKKTEEKSKTSKAKEAAKVAKEAIKKGAAKHSLLAALAPILMGVFVFIVILIIIIGIAMFFVTLPGMVMEKLKALFEDLGNFIAAWYGADTTEQISDTDVFETLDYLEQMGYDLKGYGFLTDYVGDDDSGVEKEDDKITNAKSDYIFTYIASNNYVYTLKNGNIATQEEADTLLEKIGTAIATSWYRVQNFFFGPVFDFLGVTNAVGETWGEGLIGLYYEKDNQIGKEGQFVNQGTLWNWDNIKINVENKTLSIARNELFNNNNAIEFSLDGWTGRYGMPLEFLLSVHIATMMPDLAVDMVQYFPTEIKVYLHDVSGEATTAYKTGDDYVTYEELETALSGVAGRNIISSAFAWVDDIVISDEEATSALEAGIPHSPECTCNPENINYTYAGYPVTSNGDGTYTWIEPNTGASISIPEENVTKQQVVCDKCKDFIKRILKLLRKDNDYNFKAYMPYIASVNNHWYRDVYFVMEDTNLKFVDYDYEYEALMKERWTLYETYTADENPEKEGEYKLYEVDGEGKLSDEPYEGTEEEAAENGIKLVKKAITLDASDSSTMEDLGWNKPEDIWIAYEENNSESSTEYEPAYPDIGTDESDYEIKKNIYVQVKTVGNVVQTGEGQRTETNPIIKKLFLQNRYFRYDGSAETAEIITELRKKVAENHGEEVYYSSLNEEDLKETVDTTNASGETETNSAEEYSGNVTLNQDSLNAFSMLENTHTMDADYIYRDFKELMVELGYFTKEELTDETPRLLQFLVPDIGSGGYPMSSIDKREQEYGTMIHSKGDIDANYKNTLTALYQKIVEMEEQNPEKGNAPETASVSGISNNNNSQNLSQVSGVKQNSNSDSNSVLTSNSSNVNLNNVKGTTPSFVLERVEESGDGYESVVQSGNVKYIHRYQGGQSYSDIGFLWAGQSNTLGQAACGLFSCFNVLTGYGYDFDPARDLAGFNWGATMDAVKTLMEEKGVTGQFVEYTDTAAVDAALNEGRPVILLFAANAKDKLGICWTTAGHFVALVGKDSEGNILTLDSAAQGSVERHDYPGTVDDMQPAFQTSPIWIADEPPTGMKQGEAAAYEGYEGNEAVVSPVTGVLLEYDTYTDEDIDSVSGEEYRTNVDLKYGPANKIVTDEEGNPIPADNQSNQTNPENGEPQTTGEGGEIVADKVGYAKILVLDAENYQKLEANTGNRWKNSGDNLVKINETASSNSNTTEVENVTTKHNSAIKYLERLKTEEQMDEEHENWSSLDKTVYGYKEFAEIYEKAGISGYIVYIDGFVCEEPDEKLSGGEGDSGEESETAGGEIADQLPEGKKLTMDSFKVREGELEEQAESEDAIQSKYERDEEYKLASKESTDKLNAESAVKEAANTAITINDSEEGEIVFIKEGTVLGRTMTDREVVEKIRKDSPHPYEYYRPDSTAGSTGGETGEEDKTEENEEENQDKVIGNYIRIIMRDLDDTVVENVEDYMKLDEGGEVMEELDDEKFLYWMGIYAEGGVLEQQGDKWISVPKDLSDGAGATHYFGLTHYNLDLAKKLGYNISNWGDNQDLEMLTDVYLALIEEQKAQIRQELGENIEDGYLQAFISILHNYGRLTKRGDEYKSTGKVSESTWTTYEDPSDQYAEALTKRRIGEWILITEGKYMNFYDGNTQEIDFTEGGKYSEETPFTDWCKDHGITNIEVKKADE